MEAGGADMADPMDESMFEQQWEEANGGDFFGDDQLDPESSLNYIGMKSDADQADLDNSAGFEDSIKTECDDKKLLEFSMEVDESIYEDSKGNVVKGEVAEADSFDVDMEDDMVEDAEELEDE